VGYGNTAVRAVMAEAWPFGDPWPRTFYDVPALEPRPKFALHLARQWLGLVDAGLVIESHAR